MDTSACDPTDGGQAAGGAPVVRRGVGAGRANDPAAASRATVDHYERHLAPLYSWMLGGARAAIERGRADLAELGLSDGSGRYALDLGAGFGVHAIPLARAGWRVLAIDSSAFLLDELKASSGGAPVAIARDDLLRFPRHLSERPELVLCMGDTLTHLDEHAAVTSLIAEVARSVAPGSRFVLTFRDDPGVSAGTVRRIPVRSDGSRRLVCTLEYAEASVCVHDQLHELIDGAWRTRASTYRKLRLASTWVAQQLEQHGFVVDLGAWPHGMVRLDAVLT